MGIHYKSTYYCAVKTLEEPLADHISNGNTMDVEQYYTVVVLI